MKLIDPYDVGVGLTVREANIAEQAAEFGLNLAAAVHEDAFGCGDRVRDLIARFQTSVTQIES